MAFYHRIRRQFLSRVQLVRVLLIASILGLGGLVFWVVRPWVTAYRSELPTVAGRGNLLLFGGAGGEHAGADLTDTMIFVSLDSAGKVSMLSIPRDIWVPSMRAKINTAYHYGEEKQPDKGGFILAKSAVNEIINQPVQFVGLINFADFQKVIDTLGGVDINVERAFDDNEFPIAGLENDLCDGDLEYKCRYEPLHFDAGLQHMNGATALKYVRSRHAEGDEGTDFARGARQEKLLLALKDKLLSKRLLTRPKKIQQLYQELSSAVSTDIPASIYPALVKLAIKAARINVIHSAALSEPDQLYHPPILPKYENQWVLLPRNDQPQMVFDFVADLLSK